MIVRSAKFTDIPGIVELAEHARQASSYNIVSLNEEAVKLIARQVIIGHETGGRNQSKLLIAERDGEIIGMFLGFCVPLYEVLSVTVATNHIWYAKRPGAGMKLLGAFCEWAMGEFDWILFRFGLNDTVIETDRLEGVMEHIGFRKSGTIMEKEYRQ